jgi:Tfp pilus assembly protein PilF
MDSPAPLAHLPDCTGNRPQYNECVIRVLLMTTLVLTGLDAAEVSSAKRPTPAVAASAASGIQLAESGHCREALPLLKSAVEHVTDPAQKRRLGLDAVRCAMSLDDADSAGDFARALKKQFPRDPEVLYVAVHVFSDLSVRSSRELSVVAPGSYQMHELNAEAMEAEGKQEDAVVEYREVLKKEPNLRGIHYRIGRLLLSGPNKATEKEEARHEFEEELKVDPSSAASEYVLGEMARQDQETSSAIEHFGRATKLDAGFTDAFIGLGRSLIEGGRSGDAIAPLQAATKLQPDNPAAHFYLATAFQRSGRAEDAGREFALQQQAAEKVQRAKQDAQAATSGKEK